MGMPPPEATAFQRELFSYMLVRRRRFQKSQEKPESSEAADGDGSESEGEAALAVLDGRFNCKAPTKGL
eukprot:11587190-Heterocapsa_arctica.AAC.1